MVIKGETFELRSLALLAVSEFPLNGGIPKILKIGNWNTVLTVFIDVKNDPSFPDAGLKPIMQDIPMMLRYPCKQVMIFEENTIIDLIVGNN